MEQHCSYTQPQGAEEQSEVSFKMCERSCVLLSVPRSCLVGWIIVPPASAVVNSIDCTENNVTAERGHSRGCACLVDFCRPLFPRMAIPFQIEKLLTSFLYLEILFIQRND